MTRRAQPAAMLQREALESRTTSGSVVEELIADRRAQAAAEAAGDDARRLPADDRPRRTRADDQAGRPRPSAR